MPNSKELFHDLVNKIHLDESPDEIRSIVYWVFENLSGFSKADILSNRPLLVDTETEKRLAEIIRRLNAHEPIQYILGEADFYGRKFKVNSSVLIPRPETEELVRLILSQSTLPFKIKILDIGTGSGCIPITFSLEISGSEVFATDISAQALEVAKENSMQLKANVTFIQHDILQEKIPFQNLDIVVSNPPYITLKEEKAMKENVVKYEPHLALFVPNDDALLFYKAIAAKAKQTLKPGGNFFVEINEQYGREVAQSFSDQGFSDVQIVKDLAGKDRIVKGILTS